MFSFSLVPSEEDKGTPTTEVYVVKIRAESAASAIKSISASFPSPLQSVIKRIKRIYNGTGYELLIWICEVENWKEETKSQFEGVEFFCPHSLSVLYDPPCVLCSAPIRSVVPSRSPRNAAEQREFSELWSLLPSPIVDQPLPENTDSSKLPLFRIKEMEHFSSLVRGASDIFAMIVKPSLSEDESPEILHVIKAGEFVECGKSSSFHPRLNPLQHASMLLIDAVAKQLVENELKKGAEKRHRSDEETETDTTDTQYLCTGFDVYLKEEPCVMCSMALLHSRIRCAVYFNPLPRYGALGSAYRIHNMRSLNHRFAVYVAKEKATFLKKEEEEKSAPMKEKEIK